MRWLSILILALVFPVNAALAQVAPANFKGQKTLVSLWRADCAPCLREVPILAEIAKARPDLQIITISLSSGDETHRYFKEKLPENRQLWIVQVDDKQIMKNFGDDEQALPFSAMLKSDGSICEKHIGILGTDLVDTWEKAC